MKANLPVLLAGLILFGATGCEQLQLASQRPRPMTPATAPKAGVKTTPPSVTKPKVVTAETTVGGIRFTKTLPPDVVAGSEFASDLTITVPGGVTNVIVRDAVPAGAVYLRSEPTATVEGGELVWKLGSFSAPQVVKIKIWHQAEQAGPPSSVATITAGARSASVSAGRPMLWLEKTGPEIAVLGADVVYAMTVRNIGSAAARGVVVSDIVPAGLNHSSGKSELSFDLGDLSPGQTKPITITLKANQRGKVCSMATVTSTNTAKVSKEICTLVLVPALKVEKSGTKEQIIGRNADYEILVTNTGDTTLTNVLITDLTPEDCAIVAAPGAQISGNKATWTIAELKPGAKRTETIKLTAKNAGASCNTVTASVGGLSETAKACTQWKGVPALTFELTDTPDPIQIGESTTYTIKLINQGSGDIRNVNVTATFDALVLPISSPQGRVSGQRVTFPEVASIGAKQSLLYTIAVKGTTAGDSRNKVEVTCNELKAPVSREESTTIY